MIVLKFALIRFSQVVVMGPPRFRRNRECRRIEGTASSRGGTGASRRADQGLGHDDIWHGGEVVDPDNASMRGSLVAILCVAAATSTSSGLADDNVAYDNPDAGKLRVVGALSGSMVGFSPAAFNWGGFGQVNFSPVPAIELQGVGTLNLPGSGMSQIYGEAGAFVGYAWRGGAKLRTGGYTEGNYVYTTYAHAEGGARKKLGVDAGGYLDRHGVHYWANDDKRRFQHVGEPRVPIDAGGVYVGIKYVQQTNLVLANGAAEWMRFVFFAHAIYAVRQSVEVPAGDTIGPKYSPGGARFGFEVSATYGLAPYFRFEFGGMPSINGQDLNIIMMLGLSAADSLEWTFGRGPSRVPPS